MTPLKSVSSLPFSSSPLVPPHHSNPLPPVMGAGSSQAEVGEEARISSVGCPFICDLSSRISLLLTTLLCAASARKLPHKSFFRMRSCFSNARLTPFVHHWVSASDVHTGTHFDRHAGTSSKLQVNAPCIYLLISSFISRHRHTKKRRRCIAKPRPSSDSRRSMRWLLGKTFI